MLEGFQPWKTLNPRRVTPARLRAQHSVMDLRMYDLPVIAGTDPMGGRTVTREGEWQPLPHGGSAPCSPGPSPQWPNLNKEEEPQGRQRDGAFWKPSRAGAGLLPLSRLLSLASTSCTNFHTGLKRVGNVCNYGTVLVKSCLSHRSLSSVNARQDLFLTVGFETSIACPRG